MCPPKLAVFSQLGIQYCLNQLNPEIFPRLFASDQSVSTQSICCQHNSRVALQVARKIASCDSAFKVGLTC